MRIVICIENAIDVTQPFQVSENQKYIGNCVTILNPWDEFALEAALLQKEKLDAELIVLTIGDEKSDKSLRNSYAMGCDAMIRVAIDPFYLNNNQIAEILARTIQKIGDVSLICFGRKSIDFETGMTATMVAKKMGLPFLPSVSTIEEFDKEKIISTFRIDQKKIRTMATLPAVISISKDFAEPRFPSFLGTRKAAKTSISVYSLNDLFSDNEMDTKTDFMISTFPIRNVHTEMIQGNTTQEIVSILENKLKEASV